MTLEDIRRKRTLLDLFRLILVDLTWESIQGDWFLFLLSLVFPVVMPGFSESPWPFLPRNGESL